MLRKLAGKPVIVCLSKPDPLRNGPFLQQIAIVAPMSDTEGVLFGQEVQPAYCLFVGRRQQRGILKLFGLRVANNLGGWQSSQCRADRVNGCGKCIRLHLIEVLTI